MTNNRCTLTTTTNKGFIMFDDILEYEEEFTGDEWASVEYSGAFDDE